jgi:hypothetical protein
MTVSVNTGAMEHQISSQFKVFLYGLAALGQSDVTVDEGLKGTIHTHG